MATLIISKDELFNLVNQATVFMANPVGSEKTNTDNRLAEVVPLTKDNMDFLNIKLYEVGIKILKKIAPYTSGKAKDGDIALQTIQYPYTITDATDPTYPNSFVLQYYFYTDNDIGAQSYMIQQAVIEALSKYVIKEWLKTHSFPYQIYEQEFEEALGNIKSAFMYGRRAKTKFRTL